MAWRCPRCNAPAHGHGKGGQDKCLAATAGASLVRGCEGLICECDGVVGKSHGTAKDPCPNAACYHCGWGGTVPDGLIKCPHCHGTGKVVKR